MFDNDMCSLIRLLADPTIPHQTANYCPILLVRLAKGGYIRVGVSVSLTAKGRKLAQQLKGA
jgi:hypothetical protein